MARYRGAWAWAGPCTAAADNLPAVGKYVQFLGTNEVEVKMPHRHIFATHQWSGASGSLKLFKPGIISINTDRWTQAGPAQL